MRKLLLLLTLLFIAAPASFAQAGGFASPVGSSSSSSGGTSAPVIQSGLLAEYRMLATETPAALVDYSGNGNNATGTVGSAPAMSAVTGGLACNTAGAVILPSALNVAKTVQVFVGFTSLNGFFNSPVFGNGNGTGTNGTGIVFVVSSNPVPGGSTNRVEIISNNVGRTIQKSAFAGNAVVSMVLDTTDHIYINEKEEQPYFAGPGVSSGLQTVGAYQLCGSATGAAGFTPNYSSGQVFYALFYNRALAATEIAANVGVMTSAMRARGVIPALVGGPNSILSFTAGNTAVLSQLVFDGDSITAGAGTSPIFTSSLALDTTNGTWNVVNQGLTGATMGAGQTSTGQRGCPSPAAGSMLCNGDYAVDMSWRPLAQQGAVVAWGGTNDIANSSATANDTWSASMAYCRQRKQVGWKTFFATMMSRGGVDTAKNTFDTLARQNWTSCFDGLIDVAADPNLGADGSSASATYFQGDSIHPNTNSALNIIAPMMNRAINRFYGPRDFSTASVYASAAVAANATTAGTESTNTVTLTFAANIFPVGSMMTCTGITPAGYNSPAGLGWYVLSSNGTQVTFFNPTTGLGAVTVQGTCQVPQQLDRDQYAVLNFGAGNFTLNTCRGFTGQNIYIRNINAGGSTLVPFGGETITGSGTTTVAAGTTAILQSTLVSSAAAGCNWFRLQ